MIPLIRPSMPPIGLISDYLSCAYDSGIWSNFGPLHRIAEQKINLLTGRHATLVSSATTGIELLLEMSGSLPYSIAVPDFTHAGTLTPITSRDGLAIIVACHPDTWAMDFECLESLQGEIDTAIIVNPFGYGIDRAEYVRIARKTGISLIFDYAGAWGDFDFDDEFPTVYSFHATKSLPIGEGGCILFPDAKSAEFARVKTNFATGPNRLIQDARAHNFKISEVTAAVLCAQLDEQQYPEIMARLKNRKALHAIYAEALGDVRSASENMSLCVFSFADHDPADIENLGLENGWTARQYYIPLRLHPGFKGVELEGHFSQNLDRCVALPSDCSLEEARTIAATLREFTKKLNA